MACGDACPKQCISFPLGADGHWQPKIDMNRCIQCHSCERACPVLHRKKELSVQSVPYATWTNNDGIRRLSSSGGTFAQIATSFLLEGGVVIGARIEGLDVRHILIQEIEDLPVLQSSKYIQSDTQSIYNQAKECLKVGKKVLFSGTGCQVAAIYNFIPEKYWNNLFTIDLICHGVPSRYDLWRYLGMHDKRIVGIKSFRDKSWKIGYAMTCIAEDGSMIRDDNNYFYNAFNNNKSLRWSCYNCKFKTGLQRCSDITIGDFWGGEKFQEERKKGLSLCVIHTNKGRALLSKTNIVVRETSWEECLPKNKDYFYPNNIFRYNPFRWFYPYLVRHLSDQVLNHVIGSNGNTESKKYIPLVLIDVIFQHFNYFLAKKAINKILWKVPQK